MERAHTSSHENLTSVLLVAHNRTCGSRFGLRPILGINLAAIRKGLRHGELRSENHFRNFVTDRFGCSACGIAFSEPQSGNQTFSIYDNMVYKGKPDTAQAGLIACNILYEYNIWPKRQSVNALPKREEFEALVRETITSPGPLVIEVETLPLRITPELGKHNMEMLAQLADWAHEAAPGKVIGFFGTNTLSNVPPEDQAIAK